jgi:hypothetical protein
MYKELKAMSYLAGWLNMVDIGDEEDVLTMLC